MNKLFTETELEKAVENVAFHINGKLSYNLYHPKDVVFICVLNGAFMFFSDLMKQIEYPCQIDFIRVKSYVGKESTEINLTKDIELNIKNKIVFLVDDIYDSGKTIAWLTKHLVSHRSPREIIPVTLFAKQNTIVPRDLICGIELTDESFLVGYGLDDENGFSRNLPFILGDQNQD